MPGREAAPPTERTRTTRLGRVGPEGLLEDIGVQRRAPFAESRAVGIRGARTQQKILLAALEVFGQLGYHACGVEAITAAAGCSRSSFYQYFSSKEDLFRQLAGVVAREQYRIADLMGPITPDEDGWENLRAWLDAQTNVYETYRPVFTAFSDAAGSDALIVSGAARVGSRLGHTLVKKVDDRALRAFDASGVHFLLSNGANRAARHRRLLQAVAPQLAPERDRMLDALADVLHRALFGRRGGGFVEHRAAEPVSRVARPPAPPEAVAPRPGPTGQVTQERLLDAAAATFAKLRYHEARVDDIVGAAGTSHGTFYRYFENKEAVFRAVTARAGQRLFSVLLRMPDVSEAPSSAGTRRKLKAWITEYSAMWQAEGAIVWLWTESAAFDEHLSAATARALDIGSRRLMAFLAHRDFGDLEIDAVLMMAMLDLGPFDRERAEHEDEVLLKIMRRGFLGLDGR